MRRHDSATHSIRSAKLLWLVAVSTLLAACSAGDSAGTTNPPGPTTTVAAATTTEVPTQTTTTEPAPTTLRVTTLGVCSEAHLAWGMAKGTFSNNGIEVELVQTAGGAAGLAAVVSGSADLSSTNPASAILAAGQGFEVKIVSGSFDANPDGPGFAEGVVVRSDSPIQGPRDLSGRKVAVNELGSQNHFFTKAWIRQAGVDPNDVNILALPFPELVPAVLEGRVDAALMTGSQVAGTVGDETGRLIGNPLTDVVGAVPIATYIGTDQLLASNGAAVDAFVAGLAEADAAVTDPANRDDVLAVMSDYCGAPVPALQGVRFPAWRVDVDPATIEDIMGVLVQEGAIREPIDTGLVLAPIAS